MENITFAVYKKFLDKEGKPFVRPVFVKKQDDYKMTPEERKRYIDFMANKNRKRYFVIYLNSKSEAEKEEGTKQVRKPRKTKVESKVKDMVKGGVNPLLLQQLLGMSGLIGSGSDKYELIGATVINKETKEVGIIPIKGHSKVLRGGLYKLPFRGGLFALPTGGEKKK